MARASRATYRRRRLGAAAAVLAGGAALAGGIYAPVTLLAPVPAVAAVIAPVEEPALPAAQLAMPGFGFSGIASLQEQGTLASVDDGAAHPIASITKTVTALVVLGAQPMGPGEEGASIELSDRDVDFYWEQISLGGSVQPVSPGVVVTQRDLLEAMLLPSANNYAQSLAAWAFGSEEAYVDAARAWLAEQGMTGTTVVDASGVDDANTSTVTDLLHLGRLVLADPVLAPIVATPAAEVPDLGLVENTNRLLGIAGVDGIKTGTAPLAGACLLFSADAVVGSRTVSLVGVVLGGDSHDQVREAVAALIDSVVAGYREVEVVAAGEPFASYGQVWGDRAQAIAREAVTMLVWSDTPVTIVAEAGDVALAEEGSAVGTVTVTTGPRTASVPLVLDATIEDPGAWWRLTNPGAL